MNASRKTREELNYIGSEIKARFDFADKHDAKAAVLRTSAIALMESVADHFSSRAALISWTAKAASRHPATIYRYLAGPTPENSYDANSQPDDIPENKCPPPRPRGKGSGQQVAINIPRARLVSSLTEEQWAAVLAFIQTNYGI